MQKSRDIVRGENQNFSDKKINHYWSLRAHLNERDK